MNIKNKKISLSKADTLPLDEFDPQNVKVRITTMLDKDVVDGLKEIAKRRGHRYQTLLNKILRSYLFCEEAVGKGYSEARVREIVKEELRKKA